MKSVALIATCATLLASGAAFADEPASASGLRSQLIPGLHVKVEGSSAEGVFHARHIALRDTETTAKIEGEIDVASPDRRQLQVVGFNVTLDAATRLYRGTQRSSSRAILTRGAWIEAKGSWRDGILNATRIRLKDAPEPTEEIEGIIESFEPGSSTVVILSRRIVMESDTTLADERTGHLSSVAQTERLRRDDDDGEGRAPLAFGTVVLGGRLEAGFLDENNFRVGDAGAQQTVLSRVQVLASSQVTDTVEAYGKITFSRNVGMNSGTRNDARLSEAYLLFHEIRGMPLTLQVGRQRFRDSREWFYDEYLDALRLHATFPIVKLEGAISRGLLSGSQIDRSRRDQLQLIGSATTSVRRVRLAFHALARRDDTRNERPIWLSGTIDGHGGKGWSYWSDIAVRRGTSGPARLGGWALDTGLKHAWIRRWAPTVTAAYAFGSGDATRGDGIDTRFRQTDLEDNQAYFGGLRRLAVYGELFAPELSNLHVLTLGLGVQPRRSLAFDAVYHEFAQASASSSLPSSNLSGTLTGARRALGREVDVVVTIRTTPGLDIDMTSGFFKPGPAFGDRTRPAFFWRPQLRFYF